MDRELSKTAILKNRWRLLRRLTLIIGVFGGAFFLLRYLLKARMVLEDFQVVTVERGVMENTITASGLVVPAFEQQINAPVNTEIKSVLLRSGTRVEPGDLIIELDEEFVRLEFESINDELELKKNNITKLRLEFEKNLRELDYENQIKALQLSSLEAKLKDARRLKEIGGATQEEVQQAELNLQIANLEKKKLENDLNFRKQTINSDRRNLELEVMIQEKKLSELRRKLKETSVVAPRPGVITWLNEDIGMKVSEGDPIVRMADLESFRVEASCSDRYASLVKVGMPVKVRINQSNLPGTIVSILPAVENNTLEFVVALEEANHKELRPSMRVEVFIISDRKEQVLRVKNGPVFTGAVQQPLFVIRGDKAVMHSVRIGLTNMDYVELESGGLREGDRVIISDMEDYDHLETIELR